jgi:hypothetical protein
MVMFSKAGPLPCGEAPDNLHTNEDDQRLDAMVLMERGFRRAVTRVGMLERFYRLGTGVVRLRFAGDALIGPLRRAIAHLEVEPVARPGLTVDLWDSASAGTEVTPLIRLTVDLARREPFDSLSPRQEVRRLDNDRVFTTFESGSGVLTMFDSARNHGVYWVNDGRDLPYYERGAPLRTIFNWWLAQNGMHCVHAGAVGTPQGAVLLTGKGGSGKSTSSLACVGSDLSYASDDYCVISDEAAPHVYSLYNTGKLNGAEDLARQPHFEPWVVNPDKMGNEKLLMFLHEHLPQGLLKDAPLRAIVLPTVTDRIAPALRQVSAVAALKALAPTTMFQLPGARQNSLKVMARLVAALPCYQLECGSDIAAIPELLGELLSELAPDRACEPMALQPVLSAAP